MPAAQFLAMEISIPNSRAMQVTASHFPFSRTKIGGGGLTDGVEACGEADEGAAASGAVDPAVEQAAFDSGAEGAEATAGRFFPFLGRTVTNPSKGGRGRSAGASRLDMSGRRCPGGIEDTSDILEEAREMTGEGSRTGERIESGDLVLDLAEGWMEPEEGALGEREGRARRSMATDFRELRNSWSDIGGLDIVLRLSNASMSARVTM